MVIGVDIGGTNLRIGVVSRSRQLSHFTMCSSRDLLQGEDSGSRLVDLIVRFISDTAVVPLAVGVGFPSTVDRSRRVVRSTSNVPGLDGLPFAELVEARTGIRTFINRDTNLHLLNDIVVLGLESERTVVGCYPGTGFGSGLWLCGKLHVGRTGSEGELGHLPIKGGSRLCGCGNRGCVETVASGKYLEELLAEVFPDTPIQRAFLDRGDSKELEDFVDNLSIPIASAVNLLDPDAVVVGGGVIAMEGFPRDKLLRQIRIHTRKPEPASSLRVLFAEPRQDNAVMGAGLYAFKELEEK